MRLPSYFCSSPPLLPCLLTSIMAAKELLTVVRMARRRRSTCTCRRFEALRMHTSEKEDRRANEWAVHVVLEKGMMSWRSFRHCLFCCAPAMLRLLSPPAFLFCSLHSRGCCPICSNQLKHLHPRSHPCGPRCRDPRLWMRRQRAASQTSPASSCSGWA